MKWNVGDRAWSIEGIWPYALIEDGICAVTVEPVRIIAIGDGVVSATYSLDKGPSISVGRVLFIPVPSLFLDTESAIAKGLELRAQGMAASGHEMPHYGFDKEGGHVEEQEKDAVPPESRVRVCGGGE